MPEELMHEEPLQYDFSEVIEVEGKDAANQKLSQGWKLINSFKKANSMVYVLGWPKSEEPIAKRPPQKQGALGVIAFFVGVFFIWIVVSATPSGLFMPTDFGLLESALLLVGILFIILGLSQIAGMIPAVSEHMK
jgi:hypothetical protein